MNEVIIILILMCAFAFLLIHLLDNMYRDECERANNLAMKTWLMDDKIKNLEEALDKSKKKYNYLKNK